MGGPNNFLPLLMVEEKKLLANILSLFGSSERIFKYPEPVPDPANILLLCGSSERMFKYPELVVDPLLSRS